MRFHLVATFYVFVFGCFYDFSAAKWALLAVLCALIIALEMINTCVEKLCDLFCDRYDFSVKIIKDIAAAAVLAVLLDTVQRLVSILEDALAGVCAIRIAQILRRCHGGFQQRESIVVAVMLCKIL